MPTIVKYVCNAGMERVFVSLTDEKVPVDISKNREYAVFFVIKNPLTAEETRYLSVVLKEDNTEKLRVPLNKNGGHKPAFNNTAVYRPNFRRFIKEDKSDVELERMFFAETNLTDDLNMDVRLLIKPATGNPEADDIERFLRILTDEAATGFKSVDINLERDGGKKPLGGGGLHSITKGK